MVQDEQDEAIAPRPRAGAGRVALFAGVAGACVFGAALGMWARPSDLERPGAARPTPQAVTPVSTDRRLPIVVDDSPAPIGKPLDVLSQSPPRPAVMPRRQDAPAQIHPVAPDPQLLAPSRPPNGLVRVTAPLPGPMAVVPRRIAPTPLVAVAPKVDQARIDRAKQQQARLDDAKVHAAQLAQARAERAQASAEQRAEARAEAKAERLAQQKARRDKAKARQIELAQAAADAEAKAKVRHGIVALIARFAPHHAKLEIEANDRPDRRRHTEGKRSGHETGLAKLSRKSHPAHGEAPAAPLMARGAGPIRVANVTTRCASPDPGEALACGDPALGAAQRRLTRAYAEAEAAGVPSATLEQQQARWRAARAAAAREAPWAVREVYQARIAELQDLTRSAKGE